MVHISGQQPGMSEPAIMRILPEKGYKRRYRARSRRGRSSSGGSKQHTAGPLAR